MSEKKHDGQEKKPNDRERNCWHCTYNSYNINEHKNCCDLDDHLIEDVAHESCNHFLSPYAKKPGVIEEKEQYPKYEVTENGHCWDCKHASLINEKMYCLLDNHEIENMSREGCPYYSYLNNRRYIKKKEMVSNDFKENISNFIRTRKDVEYALVNAGIYRLAVKGGGTNPLNDCPIHQLCAVFKRIYGERPNIKEENQNIEKYTCSDDTKEIIWFDDNLYEMKKDQKFVRLVDKKTGSIKKMYKKSEVRLVPKNDGGKMLDIMEKEIGIQ